MTCGRRWGGPHAHCALEVSDIETPRASAPPAPTLPGYHLEEVVAHGGFGTILAARREQDGLKVAIKVAHPESPLAWRQLTRETEALHAIGAPLVPAVYETGMLERGEPYLVMQFISHPTLAHVLEHQDGPMPAEVFAPRALALVDALGAVHARGFLHGDLKPENIFLDDAAPAVSFFDFGLARPLVAPAPRPIPYAATPPTRTAFAGTAEYMAPEQCTGEMVLDARTDLYALGVIFYEMLTGRPPFFGLMADVIQAQVSRRPIRLSELAPVTVGLEQVVLRCLVKEPARRFPSATALRQALQEALVRHAPPPPVLHAPAERATSPALSTRRSVAALFFHSGTNPITLQKELAGFGGRLVFQEGTRFVGVFDPDVRENPVQRAQQAARGLSAQGLASATLVDVLTVTVQRRPGGSIRYLSPAFSQKDRFPSREAPHTLLLTAAAAEALPEQQCVPVPGHNGLLRYATTSAARDDTTLFQRNEVLVGRDHELAALMESARRAVEEDAPSLVTVLGDWGQGKTHLCATLAHALQMALPKARVHAWRAREPVQGDPEGTLRLLLTKALYSIHAGAAATGSESEGRALCAELLGPRLAAELWPGVAATLGWHSPDDTGLRHWATAPGALRLLAIRATGALLAARARQQPLCILLDDMHHAEETALDALEYATRAESCLPLWVCVLARPGFESHRPSWGTRAAQRSVLPLGPLSPASAAELCRTLLRPAENVPAKALERIARRAQRIPLLLVELVRGLKRQGLVRQRASGESWYLAADELDHLPELRLVEWLADRELGALPPELAAHARLCALLGPDFTAPEAEGVVHALEEDGGAADFPLDPQHATHRLLELGLLVNHPPRQLGFRNELLRATVERSLPEADRVRIHHAAYRYNLGETGTPQRQRLPRLALHAAAAGLREEAATLYIELAESARGRHAYLEAESTYSRALELLDVEDTRRRLTVLQGRGLMRYRVGRSEDSLADFAGARELAGRLGEFHGQVELLLDEAMAFDWINDYARAEERVSMAQELAASATSRSPLMQVRLLLGRGRALFRRGQWLECCAPLEEAVLRARSLGNAGYESLVVAQLLLGFILPNLGRIDEAERILEEGIVSCIERGDRLHMGSLLNNRRNLWVARDNLEGALRDQECFMQLGRELGMASWEYFAEHNMGELLYQAGKPEVAASHIARAIELERRHPEVAPRPWALLLRARLCAYTGQDAEGRALLAGIRHKLEERGAEFSPSEQVLVRLVELATGEARAEEWRALRSRSDECSVEQEPLEVLEVQALARWRRGEREEALRLMEEALEWAARIPNIMRARLERGHQQVLTSAWSRGPRPVDSQS
jgi:serine/threonine protein kinase/tetratricopeptide (TPR) repeat protein